MSRRASCAPDRKRVKSAAATTESEAVEHPSIAARRPISVP
jgi:hypothetical protein